MLRKILSQHLFCYSFLAFCGSVSGQNLVKGVTDSKHFSIEIYKPNSGDKCSLLYYGIEAGQAQHYNIIDKVLCDGKEWYEVFYYGTPNYFVETKYFTDTFKISSEIIELVRKFPKYSDRIKPITDQQKAEELRQTQEVDSFANVLDKSLKVYRDKGAVVWSWSWSYSNEYSSFADIEIEVLNPYKQKIKYIWFTFRAYNAVDDIIRLGFSGKTDVIVKGIGPIEYSGKASYNFEDALYSKVINSVKMTQIKIQFFDGTFKTYINPIVIKSD